jgi:hypothetical protein
VHSLKGAKHVADIRNYGLAAGFTIALPGEPAKRPYEIAMNCWKKGFYVRYGGDTIQLAPPFISEKARDRPPGRRRQRPMSLTMTSDRSGKRSGSSRCCAPERPPAPCESGSSGRTSP